MVSRHFRWQPRFSNHIFEQFLTWALLMSYDRSYCVYTYHSRGSIDLVSRLAFRMQSHAKTKKVPWRVHLPPGTEMCSRFYVELYVCVLTYLSESWRRDWHEGVFNRYPNKKNSKGSDAHIYTYIRFRTKDAGTHDKRPTAWNEEIRNMNYRKTPRSKLKIGHVQLGSWGMVGSKVPHLYQRGSHLLATIVWNRTIRL